MSGAPRDLDEDIAKEARPSPDDWRSVADDEGSVDDDESVDEDASTPPGFPTFSAASSPVDPWLRSLRGTTWARAQCRHRRAEAPRA